MQGGVNKFRGVVQNSKTENCETFAKLVSAKLAVHDLQNMAKQCETLLAKIVEVAKMSSTAKLCSTITKQH